MFNLKATTFERVVTRFILIISKKCYILFVEENAQVLIMVYLQGCESSFSNFPEAHHATDVTFQQFFRPSGSIEEGKIFF